MNFLKKCAAVLLTGAMVLSMSACSSDTDWIMRKGELEMPAGVYINNLLQSYYQASTLVENTEEDVFKQQVEGTDAKEWIQQKALDETKGGAGKLPSAGRGLLWTKRREPGKERHLAELHRAAVSDCLYEEQTV